MSKTRKEKDSLGNIAVPARAYYGAQTARAVHNYPISGMRAHSLLIRALGLVKRAAAETNKKLGLVDAHRADAISQAAQEVIDGKWDEEIRGRCVSGRRRRQLPHECQRGHRQSRQSKCSAASLASTPTSIPTTTSTTANPPTTCFPPPCGWRTLLALEDAVSRAGFARRHLREKSQRVRQHSQVRPHASAGCRPDPSRPGIRRLRRRHAQDPRQHCSAGGRPA